MIRLFTAAAMIGIGSVLITSFQGSHRLALVFGSADAIDAQVAKWETSKAGFAERDVVILKPDQIKNRAEIEKKFSLGPDAFAVFLIGKDGHTAVRFDRPVPAQTLFEAIDSMPMRKDEIRDRR